MLGGIEAGGTKFICGVGTGPDNLTTESFPTSTPDITLASVVDFFRRTAPTGLQAVGIGSFGPVDLDRSSSTWGYVTSTPKVGWKNFDLAGTVGRALGVPVGFDTDVNAALLAEARWGAAKGLDGAIYITVGTGVGGGIMANGHLIHGLVHSEIGHLHLPHDWKADPFAGVCPFHGDCLEGMASGPALQARWGQPALTLAPDHPAWKLEARYLALAAMNLTVTTSPQRIIFGGGVMQQPQMFAHMREEFRRIMNLYVRSPRLEDEVDEYLTAPALEGRAGVLGSIALAEQAR